MCWSYEEPRQAFTDWEDAAVLLSSQDRYDEMFAAVTDAEVEAAVKEKGHSYSDTSWEEDDRVRSEIVYYRLVAELSTPDPAPEPPTEADVERTETTPDRVAELVGA